MRFDHSWHFMSTLIKASAHLPDYWAISQLFKGIETVKTNINTSFFPLRTFCCFDFEIRTPDIKLETKNDIEWQRWYISVDRTATVVVWRWQFNGHLQEVSFNENHFLRFNEWRVGKYCDLLGHKGRSAQKLDLKGKPQHKLSNWWRYASN